MATVPRLFRKIEQTIEARVARLEVAYGRYGAPNQVSIDPDVRIADEETGYSVRRFRQG